MNQRLLLLTDPPERAVEVASNDFCSCKASIHDIPVNQMLDFLYELATAFENQDANQKKRKTTGKKGGAS